MKNAVLFIVIALTASFWTGYFWAKHIDNDPIMDARIEMPQIGKPLRYKFSVPTGTFIVTFEKCLEIKDCKEQNFSTKTKRRN